MTIFLQPATPARMGRPPLKDSVSTVTVLVRLPADLKARLDAAAGDNKRAEFIRAAVERELKRLGK